MKRLLLVPILLAAWSGSLAAEELPPQPQISLTRGANDTWNADWISGGDQRTVFFQWSLDLQTWRFAPFMAYGGGLKSYGFHTDGEPKFFIRLNYHDVPGIESLDDAREADFDNDGISNAHEIEVFGTNPLNSDTDGDGLPDFWEIAYGLDPNDDGSGDIRNGPDGDPDNDGRTNLQEFTMGTNPNIPNAQGGGGGGGHEGDPAEDVPLETFEADWLVLTGDEPKDVVKDIGKAVTIPKGHSALVVVAVASDEHPTYTGTGSQYNDILTWNVSAPGHDTLSGDLNVNARHAEWQLAKILEYEFAGLSPAHIEQAQVFNAPKDGPLQITMSLSAVNIGDETRASYIAVGVLPVEIRRKDPGSAEWKPFDRLKVAKWEHAFQGGRFHC